LFAHTLATYCAACRFFYHELKIQRSVTDRTVIPTIQEINGTLSRIGTTWVERQLAFLETRSPIKDTLPTLACRFGPDLYLTSWMNIAYHEWKIPGTSSTTPDFVRRPRSGNYYDGSIVILPRKRAKDGEEDPPYEIMVGLAIEDMERIEAEEGGLAKRWADRVVV
jgi:trichothecene 3-O-acetyltransferase